MQVFKSDKITGTYIREIFKRNYLFFTPLIDYNHKRTLYARKKNIYEWHLNSFQ